MLDSRIALLLMELEVSRWLEKIPSAYRRWLMWGGIALLAALVLRAVGKKLARTIRRMGPPKIHPRLEKYNVDHAKLDRERRKLAAGIGATSTGGRLPGFRIVRQVEAVFVEGCRTHEEALIALKAAAAERGANALLNVRTERTAAGKCTASGDAVLAAAIKAKPPPRPESP